VNDNRNKNLMLGRRQRDRIVGFLQNRNNCMKFFNKWQSCN